MKQKLLYICLMILCALAWSGEVWGDTSYLVDDSKTYEIGYYTNHDGIEFQWSGVAAKLTFSIWRRSSATQTTYVYGYDSSGNQTELASYSYSSLPESEGSALNKEISLASSIVRVKFVASGTRVKYFKNVKVTRATRFESFPYSTSSPYDMGTLRYGKSTTPSIENIKYHVTTYPNTLTGTCVEANGTEEGTFSVGDVSVPSSEKGTGTLKIPITFHPQSTGTKSATVTLKFGSTTVATFKVTGTGADRGTPAFTWNVTNAYKNHSYSDFFTSTNTDTGYTITSSNPSLGNVVNGKLVFYDGEGTVRFTVTQTGNVDWHAHEEYFDVNVTEAHNHLPLTITSDNYGTLVRKVTKGTCEWSNDGLTLKDNGFDDKIGEIVFEGIPDKLTFSYTRNNGTAVGMDWRVFVSSDGNDWIRVWNEEKNSGSCDFSFGDTYVNCRYVRLLYSGDYGGTFRDVTITERKYLTADKTSLAFGTNTKGNNVTAQTFTISHCNAGYGVTVASNNANFTVSPTPLTTTGGDLMGTQVITVNYLNKTTGVHNGTITISDPNGTNSPITINVSGITQTTYYTRAEAEAGEGGSAYVSYVSSEDAAASQHTTTSLKISELTSDDKATNNAYWIAIPDPGYTFVEWQWPDGSQASTQASDKWEGYEYSSEDQDDPTVVKFKAIFAPKTLTLQPTSSEYTVDYYKTVNLGWDLKAGYSTIALPFNTTVAALTGRERADDWVAQLSVVTYTKADKNNTDKGYTLYFKQTGNGADPDGGIIVANRPYVLHLSEEVVNPVWSDLNVLAPSNSYAVQADKGYADNGYGDYSVWKMRANYEPGLVMTGLYGIAGDKIKKGIDGSTLGAFRAYITGPSDPTLQVKAAYLDDDNADGLLELLRGEEVSGTESVYDLQGRQLPKAQRGLNIIRGADGSVKKVMNN